jgi:hypothetical protein
VIIISLHKTLQKNLGRMMPLNKSGAGARIKGFK